MKSTLSFLLLICTICTQVNSQNKKPQGYQIGDVVSDFRLQNIDGEYYSLNGIEDAKGYIVVFTSNVCPFAVLYEDRLIALHNELASKGYPVVAINSNDATMQEGDSFENMKLRSKEKGFPFLYLNDNEEIALSKFGATKTPHVFILDKDLVVRYIGAIDDNAKSPEDVKVTFAKNAVASIDRGETPDPATTKAIGCPVKSKNSARSSGPRGKRGGPSSPEAILSDMDKDGDMKVSLSEAQGPLKRDFDRLDKDGNGMLTKEELSALKRRKKH